MCNYKVQSHVFVAETSRVCCAVVVEVDVRGQAVFYINVVFNEVSAHFALRSTQH